MEATEIYNFAFHELVTSPFSVDWSQDNQISVITENGIHIFELQPNPLCVQPVAKAKRSFIYPSTFLVAEPYLFNMYSIMAAFEHDDLYSFMIETALTPKLPEKDDITYRISATAWSPSKLVEPSQCLLATVTSAGAIDLVFKIGNIWYSIFNLSALWWEIINGELEYHPENIDIGAVVAESFRKNLRRLVGTTVTWSQLYEKLSIFCYLVTAYRSGDLVIWKIMRLTELTMKVEPRIMYRTALDTEVKITKLLWITLRDDNQFLIVLGFFDGRIYGLHIAETDDSITENTIYRYEANADYIPVSCLNEFSRNNEEINVIVLKNYFFIVMTLNYQGELIRQHHIQLMAFSISGLTVIGEKRAIVTTRDSQMLKISLKGSDLITEEVKHDMKTSKIQFLGIAVSPNNAILVNITSPNCLYDHLVNRDPSSIQLFHFKGEEWDPWLLLNKDASTLNTHWNCLEVIRIKASKEKEPELLLPAITNDLESMSIHKLRITMWMTLITEVLKKKKIFKKIDKVVGEISEAQPLIFVHSASSHIMKLAERGAEKLSKDMLLSIHFLRLYLEVFLAGEDDSSAEIFVTKFARNALDVANKLNVIETEFCNLCEEIVTELPWSISSCPKGHKLPRCALTLLQITCLKYRNCAVCGRIFHPSLDEIYGEVKCLYCDVPVAYDSRIADVYDEIQQKCRNLSLRPPSDLLNKNQDGEIPTASEKRLKKRRANTTDNFTLIVNKDDEAITETWEEL